jgi:hypothetical protein
MVLSAKDRMRNNASEPFDRARARWTARMTKPAGSLDLAGNAVIFRMPDAARPTTCCYQDEQSRLLEPGPAMRGPFVLMAASLISRPLLGPSLRDLRD